MCFDRGDAGNVMWFDVIAFKNTRQKQAGSLKYIKSMIAVASILVNVYKRISRASIKFKRFGVNFVSFW